MPDFSQVITQRRSIRKYQGKEVPEAALNQILEAVKWSPSWANSQCWEVVVVKDQALKEALKDTLPPTNPGGPAMVNAPVVLAVCGKTNSAGYYKGQAPTKFGDWLLFDLGIATQSICLAAQNLGLGTVIVGLFNHDQAKQVLGLPAGYELVVLIPLGYPDHAPSAPKRREVSEFVHRDKF